MKCYHGYWPVLAIIKQYLGNVKKNLARDLEAEQDDTRLPGSKKCRKAKDRKQEAFNKVPKCSLDDSDSGSDDTEKSDDERLDDYEVDSEDDSEEDDSEDDSVDLEDDKAEMDIYEDYAKEVDQETLLVDKSVEY